MKTSSALLPALGWLDFYYISDQEYADFQKEKAGARRTAAAQDRQ